MPDCQDCHDLRDLKRSVRIPWIDIFKSICISFVVLGHIGCFATPYVYEFHMAAFFFISGYVTNYEKKENPFVFLFKKIHTLLLPLITINFIMAILYLLLRHFGIADRFILPPLVDTYVSFPFHSAINLLGATWFIGVLFAVHVILCGILYVGRLLFHSVTSCCRYQYAMLIFISILMFMAGIWSFTTGRRLHGIELILVAQFFVELGFFVRKVDFFEAVLSKQTVLVILSVASTSIIYAGKNYGIIFSSRTISGGPLLSVLFSVNGILFCYCLSKILELSFKQNGKTTYFLSIAGRESLGILFFHFLGFKFAYAALALFGIVDWSYLSTFIPEGNGIADGYWWLIFLISMICSILLWKIMKKIPVLRYFLGGKKETDETIFRLFSTVLNGSAFHKSR